MNKLNVFINVMFPLIQKGFLRNSRHPVLFPPSDAHAYIASKLDDSEQES